MLNLEEDTEMNIMKFLLASLVSFLLLYGTAEANSKISVVTCGADPSGQVDSAPAINKCLESAGPQTAVYFPPGAYKIGSTLQITNNFVTLYADTPASAQLNFSGCGDMVEFSKPRPNIIFNGGIQNLFLYGDGHCTQTAVHVVDSSWISVDNTRISGFADATGQSVGVQTNGREGFILHNDYISANQPILIGVNPDDGPYYLDADHFHFSNLYTQVIGTNWHITMQNGVVLTNTTIDGENAMVQGCGILRWISISSPDAVSNHLRLSNIRDEQLASGCPSNTDIDIELPVALQSLIIDNVHLSGPFAAGYTAITLHNVEGVTVRDSMFEDAPSAAAPATFINASLIRYIDLENNHIFPYASSIVATDDSNPPVSLVWKAGPYTGKECCYQVDGTGPWLRTPDSGILGQP